MDKVYKDAVVKKLYAHEIAALNLPNIYFLKNVKSTGIPNNGGLHRD